MIFGTNYTPVHCYFVSFSVTDMPGYVCCIRVGQYFQFIFSFITNVVSMHFPSEISVGALGWIEFEIEKVICLSCISSLIFHNLLFINFCTLSCGCFVFTFKNSKMMSPSNELTCHKVRYF